MKRPSFYRIQITFLMNQYTKEYLKYALPRQDYYLCQSFQFLKIVNHFNPSMSEHFAITFSCHLQPTTSQFCFIVI